MSDTTAPTAAMGRAPGLASSPTTPSAPAPAHLASTPSTPRKAASIPLPQTPPSISSRSPSVRLNPHQARRMATSSSPTSSSPSSPLRNNAPPPPWSPASSKSSSSRGNWVAKLTQSIQSMSLPSSPAISRSSSPMRSATPDAPRHFQGSRNLHQQLRHQQQQQSQSAAIPPPHSRFNSLNPLSPSALAARLSPAKVSSPKKQLRLRSPSEGYQQHPHMSSRRSGSPAASIRSASPHSLRCPSPVKETFLVRKSSVESPRLMASSPVDMCSGELSSLNLHDVRRHSTPGLVTPPSALVDQPDAGSLLINQYLILDEIGAGSYGKVVRVYNVEDENEYACKIISKSRLKRRFRLKAVCSADSNGYKHDIRHEVAVFKKLSLGHPNVTSLLEVLDDEDEDNLYMVFELCARPIMSLTMGERVEPFPEDQAWKYFRDVVLGLEYLHSQRVIHCDLKPENILLTHDDRAQISDFGIAHMCSDDTSVDDHMPIRTASPAFTPPECCDPSAVQIHGRALDVWCLGVTLYCLTHGHTPFEAPHLMELYQVIANEEPEFDQVGISSELKSLLAGLLEKDPAKRIVLHDVMQDAWVTRGGIEPLRQLQLECDVGTEPTEEDMDAAVVKVGAGLFSRLWSKLRNGVIRKSSSASSASSLGSARGRGLPIFGASAGGLADENRTAVSLADREAAWRNPGVYASGAGEPGSTWTVMEEAGEEHEDGASEPGVLKRGDGKGGVKDSAWTVNGSRSGSRTLSPSLSSSPSTSASPTGLATSVADVLAQQQQLQPRQEQEAS
ncbi:kinase-like domain-containing protein [Catenaria anguillulae PL171]|uniref:Kinase-like domain-containing protein n=1 Tax=Catenaria anguillulae PL171 TaxID=765915 RepID=A0A1Y2I3B9_9FUNG|nr:kinase-like domain-containing protein [Catenaria anguillulae PL171]